MQPDAGNLVRVDVGSAIVVGDHSGEAEVRAEVETSLAARDPVGGWCGSGRWILGVKVTLQGVGVDRRGSASAIDRLVDSK